MSRVLLTDPSDLTLNNKLKFCTPIAMLLVTLLIVSNIIVQKIVPVGSFFILTAGDFIFPFVYMLGNILTEVYGYSISRKVIWLALFCNIIVIFIINLAILLPSDSSWTQQISFTLILSRTTRIISASAVAFLFGEFLNSYLLAKLKVLFAGKKIWIRLFSSSSIGQGFDILLFNLIAFWGILTAYKLFLLTISIYFFKILYQIVLLPLIYLSVHFLKRRENIDIFDRNTNFNPFKFIM